MNGSNQHSRLTDEMFYALTNAATSRLRTIQDRREFVDQEGLRAEYERILGGLFEQYAALERELKRVGIARTFGAQEAVTAANEQLEALRVDRDECERSMIAWRKRYHDSQEQLEARDDLLRRLREWDMLNTYIGGDGERHESTSDAPYWRNEIDRVRGSNPATNNDSKEFRAVSSPATVRCGEGGHFYGVGPITCQLEKGHAGDHAAWSRPDDRTSPGKSWASSPASSRDTSLVNGEERA